MAYGYEFPYWDRKAEKDRWAISKIKELLSYMELNKEWVATHEEQYKELKSLYDDIIAGNFPDAIENAFHDWMIANANELVGSMIKNVFFELTDTGYFVAYIPDSWSDITFNTSGLDDMEVNADYGHLILSY